MSRLKQIATSWFEAFNKHDLEIFDCKLESVHGGQMIAYINHKNKRKKSDRYLSFLKLFYAFLNNDHQCHQVFEQAESTKNIEVNGLKKKA